MPQTILSVTLDVAPESSVYLADVLEKIKAEEDVLRKGDTEKYSRIKWGVPTLHFMSMSIFHDDDYDPVLVIEANFDGPPGPFWAQLEAVYSEQLRQIIRFCKRPGDESAALYEAITEKNSRHPIAPYLEARTKTPSVAHQGNRGLSRERILREEELFTAIREELSQFAPQPNPYRTLSPSGIHALLREQMTKKFSWLGKPEAARVSPQERLTDIARLLVFAFSVVTVLSIPGYALYIFLLAFAPDVALQFKTYQLAPYFWLLILPLLALTVLYFTSSAQPGEAAPSRAGGLAPSIENNILSPANPFTLVIIAFFLIALLVLATTAAGAFAKSLFDTAIAAFNAGKVSIFSIDEFAKLFCQSASQLLPVVLVGFFSILSISLPVLLLWLRWLEKRDSHHDAPPIDERELRKMAKREDWIPQNHMGSIVSVKPGILRALLARVGHYGLGLVLRVVATDGYLGSMRTVHFAHWSFINNGSRLMFLSNFDSSWDSYLDDFIEKAHGGLTLAWGGGVGFPATRFLVYDGASHGRQFKAWARHSMAVSRFWFSAYKKLTVDQIERNTRIAEGLRKKSLSDSEATKWSRDL